MSDPYSGATFACDFREGTCKFMQRDQLNWSTARAMSCRREDGWRRPARGLGMTRAISDGGDTGCSPCFQPVRWGLWCAGCCSTRPAPHRLHLPAGARAIQRSAPHARRMDSTALDIAATPRPDRRHDLDALRAVAMLLGIGLHAALSFIEFPWLMRDTQREPALAVVVLAIHGFRMPLFFFLSGYFSAMLQRSRGTGGLLKHRAGRVLLPLLLACVTILPATWGISIGAMSGRPSDGADDPARDVWTAAAHGDRDAVRAQVVAGASLDAPDPMSRRSPLAWAVIGDQLDVVDDLLAAGADPNARYGERQTALHTAAVFGKAEATQRLLSAGAEVNARDAHGQTPLDSLEKDQRATESIAFVLGVSIDFDAVVADRERVRASLAEVGGVSGREHATDGDAFAGAGNVAGALVDFPIFQHLWFLSFLCWLIVGYAIVASTIGRIPRLRVPSILVATPLCLLWLVPLTMLTQSVMHDGGAKPGFGADLSAGLLPMPHVLAHYAIFFGFGAMVFARPGATRGLGRGWWLMLPIAAALFPLAFVSELRLPAGSELAGSEDTRHLIATVTVVVYAWLMVLGLMGLFERLLNRERPWVRYVSDSSYWLYLLHLPLILGGQALLRTVQLPALAKLALLIVVTTAILLATYRYGVRYTWIGRLLNGRRTPRDDPASTRETPADG